MAIPRGLFERAIGDQSPKTPEKTLLQEKFEKVLAGNFDRVPKGCQFESEIPGIRSLSILPKLEKGDSLQIVINYLTDKSINTSITLSLTSQGELAGKLPRELEKNVSKEQILAEIIKNAEALKLDFWISTQSDILPAGKWDRAGTAESQTSPKKERVSLTPERLAHIKFLKNLSGSNFGAVSESKGFNGYHAVIFNEGFAVVESPADENATYIIDGLPPPPKDPKERRKFFKDELEVLLSLSKRDHRQNGAPFFVHNDDVSWRERVGTWIAKRNETKQKALS